MKTNRFLVASVVVALLVGFGLGMVVRKVGSVRMDTSCARHNFRYLSPELGCAPPAVVDKRGYAELKIALQDFIERKKQDGSASSVSIYFRDLENGPTLGINEYEDYAPASLLKVPMLLTYLNQEEDDPELGASKLGFEGDINDAPQEIPAKDPVQPATLYTVDDLLIHMIKYSDNRAYLLLRRDLSAISAGKDLLRNTFVDLGITDPKSLLDQTVSVKSYASIFSQLYYSSFFDNNETSESKHPSCT
jgi:hypothetical protein